MLFIWIYHDEMRYLLHSGHQRPDNIFAYSCIFWMQRFSYLQTYICEYILTLVFRFLILHHRSKIKHSTLYLACLYTFHYSHPGATTISPLILLDLLWSQFGITGSLPWLLSPLVAENSGVGVGVDAPQMSFVKFSIRGWLVHVHKSAIKFMLEVRWRLHILDAGPSSNF